MKTAAPKTACCIGLLLIVSCALALPASAKDRWPARRIAPATVHADGRGASAAAFRVQCPCPDGPTRVASVGDAAIRSTRTLDRAGVGIAAAAAAALGLSAVLTVSRRRQTHAHITS